MRAVIDTNVLVSGLLRHGPPHKLLTLVRDGAVGMVTSPALLAELKGVLERPKLAGVLGRSGASHEQIMAEVRRLAELHDPPPLPQPACRDPDDDEVLTLAASAGVDFIVSGDEDLLVLAHHDGIPIVTVGEALELARGK